MKRFPLFVCLVLLLLLVVAGIPLATAVNVPQINSISPETGPNNGYFTITIMGSYLKNTSSVMLSSCTTGDVVHGTITSSSDSSITAGFTFSGDIPTKYNVMINVPYSDDFDNYYPSYPIGLSKAYTTYQSNDLSNTPTPTATTTTTTVVTTAASSGGKNSIFFETNPTGATIYVDGKEAGSSAFSYYTDNDGTFNVEVKKPGYEDYEGKVTVVEGQRAHFYSLLTPLSSTPDTVTTTTSPSASSSSVPVSTATTFRKSTLKIPTPLPPDPPVTEESPVDPAIVLWAAGIGIIFVVIRRR